MRIGVIVAGAGMILAVATTARASIFLNYDGVNGTVTDDGFVGDVALDSFSISVSRKISSPSGGSDNREASAPTVSDIQVSGPTTSASVDLLNQAIQGEGVSAKIYITEPVGKMPHVIYAEWDLSNSLLSNYTTATDGSGDSEDQFSINFTKFTYTWYNVNTGGQVTGSESVTYDLALGQASTSATGDVTGFQFITQVPEPATIGLLLLAGPLLLRRRR